MGIKELGIRPVIMGESSSYRSSENILRPHGPLPGNPESPVPRYKHPPPVEHLAPGQTSATTHLGPRPVGGGSALSPHRLRSRPGLAYRRLQAKQSANSATERTGVAPQRSNHIRMSQKRGETRELLPSACHTTVTQLLPKKRSLCCVKNATPHPQIM
jgi:hypothetical protein